MTCVVVLYSMYQMSSVVSTRAAPDRLTTHLTTLDSTMENDDSSELFKAACNHVQSMQDLVSSLIILLFFVLLAYFERSYCSNQYLSNLFFIWFCEKIILSRWFAQTRTVSSILPSFLPSMRRRTWKCTHERINNNGPLVLLSILYSVDLHWCFIADLIAN